VTLNQLLIQKKISKYKLAAMSQVPYSTVSDLFNEKTKLQKSSVDVVYKIAQALDLSIEELISYSIETTQTKRIDFELFKSQVRHQLHDSDDRSFIRAMLKSDMITQYIERRWYPEALYTLAMLDILCRLNDLPLTTKYDALRQMKLKTILYPADVVLLSKVQKSDKIKKESFDRSLPEFKRFNIVETNIRNIQ